MNLEQFISEAGIRAANVHRVDSNPYMDEPTNFDHWKVTLRAGRSSMTVYFSKGYGHNGIAPDAAEVLDCLASDASTVAQDIDFSEFCREFGYDEDSRKAENIWKQTNRQTDRLRKFLGESAFEILVWKVERQ